MMTSRTEAARRLAAALLAVLALGVSLAGCKKKSPDGSDGGDGGGVSGVSGSAEGGSAQGDGAASGDAAATLDPAAPAPAPSPAIGITMFATKFNAGETWQGAYACGKGPGHHGLELQIVRGSPAVEAIFHFTTPQRESGSFKMIGTYEPRERHLKLTAKDWIIHPPGLATVSLDGKMSADGRTYAGTVVGNGCRTFGVSRLAR